VIAHGAQVDILVPDEDGEESVDSLGKPRDTEEEEHHEDEIVEHLDVIDPTVATVSTLSNAANSILIPPLEIYSRRPTIHLPASPAGYREMHQSEEGLDELDRHVKQVLRKRDRIKRIAIGVWSFLKTPMGVCNILGFCPSCH